MSSVRAIPYIIVAVVSDAVIYVSSDVRWQYLHPVTVAVVVSCPEVSRSVIDDEVSVLRMYLVMIRLTVRTYLNWLVRSLSRAV